ncbi:opioid-binding protein/cell adhesion molecule homolog [Lethenteron reissneri]|uniref:opioid-binding protein/cell adhesion molecule homolog n=1 Tax=Lethenteron reissneri TaxID=7753 RepID=UPI002AB74343|nr:opioid-binding protein/cell adhesion molecule homolog [Lethenteron reissneri]
MFTHRNGELVERLESTKETSETSFSHEKTKASQFPIEPDTDCREAMHMEKAALEFEEGEFLDIESIRRDQAGEYECSAANEVSAPDVRRVRVSVKYAPTITEARSVGVPVGRSVMLRCEAQADPSASFTWFKEDRRLLNGLAGLHIQSSGRHSLLTFVNVTEETYGNYTCVAANVLGASNASMLLYSPGSVRDDNNGVSAKAVASPWLLLHATFLLLLFTQTVSCN